MHPRERHANIKRMQPPVLVCDFDGTWILADVGNELCDRYGGPNWRACLERWVRGEISARDAAHEMWSGVRAPIEELVAYAQEVGVWRDGHEQLLAEASAGRVTLVLASGGYELYIGPLLGPARSAFQHLYCHELSYDDAGTLRPALRHAELACASCALCKGNLVRSLTAMGERVAFAGDGYTDLCVIGTEAVIFAVSGSVLERVCVERGAAHISFEHWDQVVSALPSISRV